VASVLVLVLLSAYWLSRRELPGFPGHAVEYKKGFLIVKRDFGDLVSGEVVKVLQEVDVGPFEHLSPRKGYRLKWMVYRWIGADALGVTVAIHEETGYGFSVEPMNYRQASFLFAPIESEEEALEYLCFLMHDTQPSIRGRVYKEVTSEEVFKEVLAEMERHCLETGDKLEFKERPPVNHTRVTAVKEGFLVERVYYMQFLGHEKLVYAKALVYRDGKVKMLEHYAFVIGAEYYRL